MAKEALAIGDSSDGPLGELHRAREALAGSRLGTFPGPTDIVSQRSLGCGDIVIASVRSRSEPG